MTLYKINIDNRNYESWNIFNATTLELIILEQFNPIQHKLFNNDVFTYNQGQVEIIHSSIRINENIPAVLILTNNKTYGREIKHKEDNKLHSGKLLYKCIPDDTRIPAFLVPYEIKQLGFSKVFTNMYVTIHYKHWQNTHPYANLSQNIGTIDVLNNYYEYQLYCKSLNSSIQKFYKDTHTALEAKKHVDIIE
jgi:hypothetical protein